MRPPIEMPTVFVRPISTIGIIVASAALAAIALAAAPTNSGNSLKTDRHGDPLPVGVEARFGSVRYRGELKRAPDGKSLATLRRNRAVYIDAESGAERKVLPGPDPAEFEAWQIVLSPDGRFVAYGSPPRIEVWNIADAKPVGRYVGGLDSAQPTFEHGTRPIAFSPDGNLLLIQIVDRMQRVGCWDVKTGEMRWQTDALIPAEHSSRAFGFANHGQNVVVLREKDKNCQLVLLRTDNGELEHIFELGQPGGHGQVVCGLAPNGEEFAFLEQNEKLRRLELPTGRAKSALTDLAGGSDINTLAYSVDGKKIALIDFFSVRICDTATGRELGRTQHSGDIGYRNCRSEYSADGRTLWIVNGEELNWHKFDGTNGRTKKLTEMGHRRPISCIAMSPDGKTVATGCIDEVTRIWDVKSCQPTRRAFSQAFGLFGGMENAGAKGLVFHPDGKNLLGAALDSRIVIWNPETGRSHRSIRVPGDGTLSHLALSRDGKMIAVAQSLTDGNDQDSVIRLYQFADGKEIRKFGGMAGEDTVLSFSPDGRYLAAGGATGEGNANIAVFEVATGRILRTITGDVHACQFTNLGQTLIYAAAEGLTIWELASGASRLKIAPPVNEVIDLIAISPDGRTLAGANRGAGTRQIYRWDLRTGEPLPPLIGHDHYITALQFTADGRLMSGSQDTTALIWSPRNDSAGTIIPPTTDTEFDALWIELTRNAVDAHKAMERLIAAGESAVQFIEKQLKPAAPIDVRTVQKLAERLDARNFADRQRAVAELESLDMQAESTLKRIAELGNSAEARRSASKLLERLDAPVHAADLIRGLRTIEILQRIGSPAAQQWIAKLATGDPAARITRAARTATANEGLTVVGTEGRN